MQDLANSDNVTHLLDFQKRKQIFEKWGHESLNASSASLDYSTIDMSETSLPSPATPSIRYAPAPINAPWTARPRLQALAEENQVLSRGQLQTIKLHDSAGDLQYEEEKTSDVHRHRTSTKEASPTSKLRNEMKVHPTFLRLSSSSIDTSNCNLDGSLHSSSERGKKYDSLSSSSDHGRYNPSHTSRTSFSNNPKATRRNSISGNPIGNSIASNPFLTGTAFQSKVNSNKPKENNESSTKREEPIYTPYLNATQRARELKEDSDHHSTSTSREEPIYVPYVNATLPSSPKKDSRQINRLRSKLEVFQSPQSRSMSTKETASPTSPSSVQSSDSTQLPGAPLSGSYVGDSKNHHDTQEIFIIQESKSFSDEDAEVTQTREADVILENTTEQEPTNHAQVGVVDEVENDEVSLDPQDLGSDEDDKSVISNYLEEVEKAKSREAPKSKPTFQRSMGLDLETVPDIIPKRPKRRRNRRSKVDLKAEGEFSVTYFDKWMVKLKNNVLEKFPLKELDHAFMKGLGKAQEKGNLLKEAIKSKIKLENKKRFSLEEIELAIKFAEKAKDNFEMAMDDFEYLAERCTLILDLITGSDYQDENLMAYTILAQAGSAKLTEWCMKGENQTQQLLRLLKDPPLQQQFLEAGGARDGNYGSCMEIYEKLYIPSNQDDVLRRVATAIALEFASPIVRFGENKTYVDPEKRFNHYKDAYQNGELDPLFSTLSVWELRHVVNSNASDGQLKWVRNALMNYHPDLCLQEDDGKRYFGVSPCDVTYDDTGRSEESWSMKRLMGSINHKIPQAWYGRFICKAFGVPTWGAMQNGDTGLVRRTSKGWKACLGIDIDESRWEKRSGRDFLLETKARFALRTDSLYLEKVVRLECIALLKGESDDSIRKSGIPDKDNPWYSLALVQRHSIAMKGVCYPKFKKSRKKTLFDSLTTGPNIKSSILFLNNELKIPAGSYTRGPTENESKAIILSKSRNGDTQLKLGPDTVVEFKIGQMYVPRRPSKYTLSMDICTLQRHDDPLIIAIITNNDVEDAEVVKVKVPHTKGDWKEIKAAKLVIGGPRCNRIRFRVLTQEQGLSLRSMTLTPRTSK